MDKMKHINKVLEKYLNSKDKSNYSNLDKVFLFYNNDDFYNILKYSGATKIEFFPVIKSDEKSLQVYFNYYNMSAIMEFDDDFYDYCKYPRGCSEDELNQSILRKNYSDKFDIKMFVEEFIKSIDNDERCIKMNKTTSSRNKKIYTLISFISLFLPFIIIGIIALLSYILKTDIKLNNWFILVFIVSIVLWWIFDDKAKKN